MPTVGVLNIAIKGTTKGLEKAVKRASGTLGNLGKSLGNLKVALGSLAAGATVAVIGREFGQVAQQIDRIAKTAAKLGITTEALAGLHVAAERTGLSADKMSVALQRFTRRVSEASRGTGAAKDALKRLGLDARQLLRLPLEQQMGKVADALQQVRDQSEKVSIAFQLFDSEGVGLVNTLSAGSAGLKRFQEEAEKLGRTFSGEEAAKVEAMNDALGRLSDLLGGLKQGIVIKLGPKVLDFLEGLEELLAIANDVPQARAKALRSPGVWATATGEAFLGKRGAFGEGNVLYDALLERWTKPGGPMTAEERPNLQRPFLGVKISQGLQDLVSGAGDAAKKLAGKTGSLVQSAQKAADSLRGPMLRETLKSAFGLRAMSTGAEKARKTTLTLAERFSNWMAVIDQPTRPRVFAPGVGALQAGSIDAVSKIAEIFNNERAQNLQKQQVDEQKRTNEILRGIDRSLERERQVLAVEGIA